MRRGFTLIELLVASILLGMLASILTMMFNQSSVAWRTGVTGVANLNDSRAALGASHDICDELLPGLGGASEPTYRTVSLWDDTQRNALRKRAFQPLDAKSWGKAKSFSMDDAKTARSLNVVGEGAVVNEAKNFSVGVRSLGPDGKPDTPDDINTWPEEID